jgi:hypothetical protein
MPAMLEAHIQTLRQTLDKLELIHQQSVEIETPPSLEDARP